VGTKTEVPEDVMNSLTDCRSRAKGQPRRGDVSATPLTPASRGPLRPAELAQASVLAALTAATALIAVIIPLAGGLSLLGSVPMGLLAYRYRIRVLVAGTVAAGVIAFLVGGSGGLMTVLQCSYVGALTGVVKRRGRGAPTVFVASLGAGLAVGVVTVVALAVLSSLRMLIFDSITANVDGTAAILTRIPHLGSVASLLKKYVAIALEYWPWFVGGGAAAGMVFANLISWWVLSRVLERLNGIPDVHRLETVHGLGQIRPLPVQLDDVGFRYPGTDEDALGSVTLHVDPGEHVAVTGSNGSGKTTLMLLLAGREPTTGVVRRSGVVGLGQPDGTAVIMQHPESQVLGSRVADDVVWGLPPGKRVDIEQLLVEVGLDGMGERDTGGLSGGELQRLAVAAALAREPALLIADEVTTMVDQRGRSALLDVLSSLNERHRMGLVHITHYNSEAEAAERTIHLAGNGWSDDTAMIQSVAVPAAAVVADPSPSAALLEVDEVGHEYAAGTPWAATALRQVSFTVNRGDGVLIHGSNGSGKSTLAWIMAGLTVPTTGACRLSGKPVSDQVGAVALSFQATRLQLMRGHVGTELASAAGFSPADSARVTSSLATVGLDAALADRRVDQLSGGQMRRVVLAGMLAREPSVLILDEPLAGLDAASQQGLLTLLTDLRRRAGLTVVVISHDFAGLADLCPRTLHLHEGTMQPIPAPTGGTT
jgi:energy-coupling factor transport system ATP-binding protein